MKLFLAKISKNLSLYGRFYVGSIVLFYSMYLNYNAFCSIGFLWLSSRKVWSR